MNLLTNNQLNIKFLVISCCDLCETYAAGHLYNFNYYKFYLKAIQNTYVMKFNETV